MIPKSEPQPFAGRKQPRRAEVILIIPSLGGQLTCSNEWRINSEVARHFGRDLKSSLWTCIPPLVDFIRPPVSLEPLNQFGNGEAKAKIDGLFMAAILATGDFSSPNLFRFVENPKNIPVTFFKSWNLKFFVPLFPWFWKQSWAFEPLKSKGWMVQQLMYRWC